MRLDIALCERDIAQSREYAKRMILGGRVSVNGKTVTKPAFPVEAEDTVVYSGEAPRYVSRGGEKLEAALPQFSVSPDGAVCVDFGASTGGFTDCLLQHGAKKIFALDSGTGQLHPSLREDHRVVSREGLNARYLKDLAPEITGCDLAVMDVSFISQTLLYDSVLYALKDDGIFISLIKPQFEVGRASIGKRGIVKDNPAQKNALIAVIEKAYAAGLHCRDIMRSPITGGDGNREYLACFRKNASSAAAEKEQILRRIDQCVGI